MVDEQPLLALVTISHTVQCVPKVGACTCPEVEHSQQIAPRADLRHRSSEALRPPVARGNVGRLAESQPLGAELIHRRSVASDTLDTLSQPCRSVLPA